MTWKDHHRRSGELASQAELALLARDQGRAESLYADAAVQEEQALQCLSSQKTRTIGITAVSAVSLYYKGGQFNHAGTLAARCRESGALPGFAIRQLEELTDRMEAERT